ncbi:MAG TPA: DUF4142 domain-containing protein [Longimicrobiales bacterium]
MDHSTSRAAVRGLTYIVATAALGFAACGPAEREVRVQPAPGESYILDDAEIRSITMAANNSEIQEGRLALQKSRNDAVRQFAQRMITDHTALNQRIAADMNRAHRPAARGPLPHQLMTNSQRTMQTLQQLEGMQFDRTYIQNQVAVHQWLLNTLDNALIPSAHDNRLEDDLKDARETVAAHLQHARQIQSSLAR